MNAVLLGLTISIPMIVAALYLGSRVAKHNNAQSVGGEALTPHLQALGLKVLHEPEKRLIGRKKMWLAKRFCGNHKGMPFAISCFQKKGHFNGMDGGRDVLQYFQIEVPFTHKHPDKTFLIDLSENFISDREKNIPSIKDRIPEPAYEAVFAYGRDWGNLRVFPRKNSTLPPSFEFGTDHVLMTLLPPDDTSEFYLARLDDMQRILQLMQ